MTPPMCFTLDNARRVVQVFDQVLRDIENDAARVGLTSNADTGTVTSAADVPLQVLSETSLTRTSDAEEEEEDPACKRAKYEDLD